ncbi:SRPBCC family protein [Streptomyces sp. OF1]|uniref:SRPBCC family protein n=2 Tax=Streptomyces alkaliterrae TaxID=2213162 RepID=A0A5P0YZ46_9ACTN|nr:SRPBCC family protein [Streptomyces alkaliterrae]
MATGRGAGERERGRVWGVEESVVVSASPGDVYALLADVRRMREWSPEVFWVWRRGRRFVGFNRKAFFVWFTSCRISVAEPARHFAFDVTVFGLPIARWGYRLEEAGGGGSLVTEYWVDHRRERRRGRVADLLGLVFTGTPPARRAEMNRAGMRTTLRRLKGACERAA